MKYQNISGQELTVIGVGVVPADETFDFEGEFNNPNFRIAGESTPPPPAPVEPETPPAPVEVTPEVPVAPTEQTNQD